MPSRAEPITISPHGLLIPDAALHLDARRSPGAVFVSHAHADHCTEARTIVCTPETAALHAMRRGPREAIRLRYGEARALESCEIELRPAGHVLGSAMLVARTTRGTVVYTGDFKLRANPFSPPVEMPRCDVLVMECTFGEPRYRFPADDELLAQLFAFIDETLAAGGTPVVLGYALGKAQETLWHLTRAGYDVVTHGAIASLCRAHIEMGAVFPGPGSWAPYRRGEVGRRVLLTTPETRHGAMVESLPSPRIAYLTGWAQHPGARHLYRDIDLVLPLSDHADFDELVRAARESGAGKVYTVHGTAKLAAHLRALGIDAEHLGEHPQRLGATQLALEL